MKAKQNLNFANLKDHLRRGQLHPEFEQAVPYPTQAKPSPARPVARKILLADDDAGVRELLGRVLEGEDYQVILAKDGIEAAAKFIRREPDMVLLDLNMPERDGWLAFRFMEAARPMLPVIVITARPNQYAHARDLGVDALMEKPLNLPVLLETIKQLLAETEAERTRRLTHPQFQTAFLNRDKPSPCHSVAEELRN